MKLPGRLAFALALAGSAAASYIPLSALMAPRTRRTSADTTESQVNPFADLNGTHLIAFVFASSECGWSTQPHIMNAIGGLRDSIRAVHGRSYAAVSVIGIATDTALETGFGFLKHIGNGRIDRAFDQIMVGGSWLNEQAMRFIWRDGMAEPAMPQIIVIERPVNTALYLDSATIAVQGADQLRANPVGSDGIMRWIAEGFQLSHASIAAVPVR